MPLTKYGLLKGYAVEIRLGSESAPHFLVHVTDTRESWRIAINVRSQTKPSDVLYHVNEDLWHPMCHTVRQLPFGFTTKKQLPAIGLDYLRSGLFQVRDMRPLPCCLPGENNDLNELIEKYLRDAVGNRKVEIYAFGVRWPKTAGRDPDFGFRPAQGVHDIHMNQGNSSRWRSDDGIRQDGALFIHFLEADRWVALFLAFQSQSFTTDDKTGHALVKKDLIRDHILSST